MSEPMGPVDPHDQAIAAEYTPLLRSSSEPRWVRLRQRLEEEGVDPNDAAIGALFPDDVGLEFGVVCDVGGRCFAFDFDFLRDPQGDPIVSRADAFLRSWRPLEGRDLEFTYARAAAAARGYLRHDG